MLYFTNIWRMPDAWPLAASMDTDTIPEQEKWKKHSQMLVKKLCEDYGRGGLPKLMSVEHGAYCYHILNSDGVLYLTFCQKGDNVAASYAFLEEISREFWSLYAEQIPTETRPYKFIKFDIFISKSRKVYQTSHYTRSIPNVEKRTYNQVMGIAEAQTSDDNPALILGGIACGVLLLLFIVLYFVLA
eukprot:TRINITY_DN1407_c0_g1_i1.p1 TRINITY_DN1407_c0_g1~~TRINITY_DN1407_c0_g1_i1.p1  ORF type:complete len:187 (+),score=32.46 TRINITY_DN1407_c0_g1_i1:51-611(+)